MTGCGFTQAMIAQQTYATAEYWYRQGLIDETDWALYRFYWRNGAFRYSPVAAAFDLDPRAISDR